MKIVATSDCHGELLDLLEDDFPSGDILIIAGDILHNYAGSVGKEVVKQLEELTELNELFGRLLLCDIYKKIVVIPGNHDWCFFDRPVTCKEILTNAVLLIDSWIEFEGAKIYGSPWTAIWHNPWAFQFPRSSKRLEYMWEQIPDDTDILITHSPPQDILDLSTKFYPARCGCELLRRRVFEVKPKLHIFGHIHDFQTITEIEGIKFANVSMLKCDYTRKERLFTEIEYEV